MNTFCLVEVAYLELRGELRGNCIFVWFFIWFSFAVRVFPNNELDANVQAVWRGAINTLRIRLFWLCWICIGCVLGMYLELREELYED